MKLTCLTCHVQFQESSSQKQHFVSPWHKNNLLRKIAGFPPLTTEEFEEENNKVVPVVENPQDCPVCEFDFLR
jgi:hypothetical protein